MALRDIIKAIQKLTPQISCGKSCWVGPQVGEIMVERTVAEVVPAVKGNKEQLDTVSYTCTDEGLSGH